MKKCINVLTTLICIVVAFSLSSCNREEEIINNSNDTDSPLTSETIVGKKLYSDKFYTPRAYSMTILGSTFYLAKGWVQTEILFAENNIAYLSYTIVCDSTYNYTSELQRISFNLAYPDVIFEDNDGHCFTASFVNNNNMVFSGGQIDEEYYAWFDLYPKEWTNLHGWHFSTTPKTVTSPFCGQVYSHSETIDKSAIWYLSIGFGANYAYFWEQTNYTKNDYVGFNPTFEGSLVMNYPIFSIGE